MENLANTNPGNKAIPILIFQLRKKYPIEAKLH